MVILALAILVVDHQDAFAQAPVELLACPDGEDALLTYPPSYVAEGQTWSARVETDSGTAQNVTITVENTTETPIVLDEDGAGRLVLPAIETTRREVVIGFEWDQNAGTQAACHGTDTYVVPFARDGDEVGSGSTTRLEGSYRAKYSRDRPGASTWKFTPQCDLLACNTKLRSSGGIKGTFRLRNDGTYALTEDQSGFGECTVRNNLTGATRTFKPAYVRHALFVLRKTYPRDDDQVAPTVVGDITDTYRPTKAARAAGCTGTSRHSKITLTRK